ncbi:isochorismatase family protein [Enterovirga rhinocerotis]|uniref:Ureidoacrylate peracid hydrolase n=1 Tax=Enterovirga rhinocerotis TaxID=1339210 RepID=A0A4R7C3V6_9HYPH|nr:isochorismatase family protein [Enterovirga rhinocerotis]TDR93134.1 ureidoacrylate peracid hydrolase [Enterovirga rhinocerotis]
MTPSRLVSLPTRPEPLTVDVARTALIVVDMQNAYCSKGGYFDRVGFDVSGSAPIIAETRRTADACRAVGVPVIYLQMGFDAEGLDVGGAGSPMWHKSNALRFMRAHPEHAGQLLTKGTWDHAIVDELAPAPGDIVVPKARYSGFAGTNLDQVLSARKIETVLVCGVATNVCVESTVRDAHHREYFPVMITDATSAAGPGQQEATEYNIATFFGWLTTGQDLRDALRQNSPASSD